jgi:hypothetical protein
MRQYFSLILGKDKTSRCFKFSSFWASEGKLIPQTTSSFSTKGLIQLSIFLGLEILAHRNYLYL